MDCSLPGSSVHGIFQARILEWVAIPFSRDLPDPGIVLASLGLLLQAGDAGDAGGADSILGLERSPGKGNGYPFQYSYLKNSMGRGGWWATVHGVAKSQTQLSD